MTLTHLDRQSREAWVGAQSRYARAGGFSALTMAYPTRLRLEVIWMALAAAL